jgi:hypothetical protein
VPCDGLRFPSLRSLVIMGSGVRVPASASVGGRYRHAAPAFAALTSTRRENPRRLVEGGSESPSYLSMRAVGSVNDPLLPAPMSSAPEKGRTV